MDKIRQFGLSKRKARKVAKSVREVNVHHHTKTCRKYNTDCRFCFPRLPSNHCIIAQEIEKDDSDANEEDRNALLYAVRCLLSAVKETLPENTVKNKENEEDGKSVKLSSFGSFMVRQKNERIGRNPKTKEEAVIDARRVVVFRASKELKNKIINE